MNQQEEIMTGVEVQRDNDFGVPGSTKQNLVDSLEQGLDEMGDFDVSSYESSLSDKEKFLILPKREISQFIRCVEPLTKSTPDQYGKSLLIRSLDQETVELVYVSQPFKVSMKVANKSQKLVDSFCMNVSHFKKLSTDTMSSVVIVQEDKNGKAEYSTTVCDSLLFLETVNLDINEFEFERKDITDTLDRELGLYNFKALGSILQFADKTSEKIIVVKNGKCYFNTSIMSASVKSPFVDKSKDLLLYKSAIDILGVLLEVSKTDVRYGLSGDTLAVSADGLIYVEMPYSENVDDHYSAMVANNLKFDADAVISNDALGRLFSYVKSFEYLSDIVTLKFAKDSITAVLQNTNMTRTSDFKFPVVEGMIQTEGEMKVSADVMKPVFSVITTDVKYNFNEIGLCMSNANGNFIVRKAQ